MKKLCSFLLAICFLFSAAIIAAAEDDVHTHDYICTAVNETEHTFTCACGDTYTQAHTFSEWTSDNNAAAFQNGTETATCAGCGFSVTRTVRGSAVVFHPFYELYQVLKDFVIDVINRLLAL